MLNSFTLTKWDFLFKIHTSSSTSCSALGSKLIWLNRNRTSFINDFVAFISSIVRLIGLIVEPLDWKKNLLAFSAMWNLEIGNNKKPRRLYSLGDYYRIHCFDFRSWLLYQYSCEALQPPHPIFLHCTMECRPTIWIHFFFIFSLKQ